jgi:hypothetical protein
LLAKQFNFLLCAYDTVIASSCLTFWYPLACSDRSFPTSPVSPGPEKSRLQDQRFPKVRDRCQVSSKETGLQGHGFCVLLC